MTPPGIAFLTVSDAAWKANETATCPRFYTDWATAKKSLELDPPETPYTPAVTIFAAFRKALEMVENEGIEAAWERHALLGQGVPRRREGDRPRRADASRPSARACSPRSSRPKASTAAKITAHMREKHGIVARAGPGQAQGQDLPHRPLRLLRAARHPHGPRGARGDAADARLPGEGRRGDERRRERVPGGRRWRDRPGRTASRSRLRRDRRRRHRAAARRRHRRRRAAPGLSADELLDDDRRLRRPDRPLRDEGDEGRHRRGRAPEGRRPRGHRRRQRRRRRGDAAWDRRREHAAGQHHVHRRAHDRSASSRWRGRSRRRTRTLTAGEWEKKAFMGTELHDKTLGIVGLGRVGTLVAQRCHAFGMKIDRARSVHRPAARAARSGSSSSSMDELFERADVITMHVVKTPETVHMIGEAELERCKPGVLIVNASRGGVDRRGRARARDQGRARSAAPASTSSRPSRSPSRRCSSWTRSSSRRTSPGQTAEAQDKAGVIAAEQVLLALRGEFVPNAVNLEAGGELSGLPPSVPRPRVEARPPRGRPRGRRRRARSRCPTTGRSPRRTRACSRCPRCAGSCSRRARAGDVRQRAGARGRPRHRLRRAKERQPPGSTLNLVRVTAQREGSPVTVAGTLAGRRTSPRSSKSTAARSRSTSRRYMFLIRYEDRPGRRPQDVRPSCRRRHRHQEHARRRAAERASEDAILVL